MNRIPAHITLTVIGSGQMAEALTKGLLESGVMTSSSFWATDISSSRRDVMKSRYQIRVGSDNKKACAWGQVVLLAVKPQGLGLVLEEIRSELIGKLVISIAAGIPIKWLASRLPSPIRLIRAMPNAPALVGEGMTVLTHDAAATEQDLEMTKILFEAIGRVSILEEQTLDVVTGLSGSGPAYACLAIEALSDGGVKMGLPRALATLLAAQTLAGAAKVVLQGEQSLKTLIRQVTTPSGATLAGLSQLEEDGLQSTVITAVQAATKRSEELGRTCL